MERWHLAIYKKSREFKRERESEAEREIIGDVRQKNLDFDFK